MVESAGVPTRFPHAAHAYRAPASEGVDDGGEWLRSFAAMRVPATTRVSASSVARVPFSAAKRAVDALRAIKGDECDRGVVKLGYSWEALDVRAWRARDDLAGALVDVLHQPGCRARHVFVQEYVRHLGEARCYGVDGRVAKILFTRFEPPDETRATTPAASAPSRRFPVQQFWRAGARIVPRDCRRWMPNYGASARRGGRGSSPWTPSRSRFIG